MKKKNLFIFMLFFIISILSFAENLVNHSKGLIIKKLDNGMTYYFYKNSKPENRVSLNVVVKAGSLQENENQKGIAHFIEHMAFNGTKNYEKNNIVKYFESIGLNFGGDLNAHTSFYETVYKLHLPTDDKEKFEKGVEILKEMVFDASLKQEDIDNEKEIIVEEWRLSQGLPERITSLWKEVFFDKSHYKDRFPIGEMDIIRGANHSIMKDYYDKWYRPENMGIILVGDIDEAYADSVIKKYFNFNDSLTFTKPETYKLEELPTDYFIFKDKEIIIPQFIMSFRTDNKNEYTEKNIKDEVTLELFKNLLNSKLKDESNSTEHPIISGSISEDSYIKDNLLVISSSFEEKKIKEGIDSTINTLKYISEFGVTEEELNLEKENILNNLRDRNNNKASILNRELIGYLTDVFITDDIFLDSEDTLKLFETYLKKITINDIKEKAREIYEDNTRFVLFIPEKDEINITKESFKNIILESKNKKIEKKQINNEILSLKEPNLEKGKVEAINTYTDYKEIKLSNGLSFLYKYTDFKKDDITIKLFKEGGSSNLDDSDAINSIFSGDFIFNSGVENITFENLDKYFKGKNFSISPYINTYTEGIIINSNRKSLDEALKYFSYLVRNPRLSPELYAHKMSGINTILNNRENLPKELFSDKIVELLYNNHPRKLNLSKNDFKYFYNDDMLNIFKKKFTNFNGYSGIIVGSIPEKESIEILEKYFASLPTENNIDTWKDLNIIYPEGIIKGKVNKGIDKKIRVNLSYPIYSQYSLENSYYISSIAKILRINFIEEVREKISGVYGISVNDDFSKYEKGVLNISFSTDPKKKDIVINKVQEELKKLLDGNINLEALKSIQKNYKLSYENNIKTNSYWLNYLSNKSLEKDNFKVLTPEEYNKLITEKNLKNFVKDFIKNDNYVEVILYPESEK
ncbi:M16 family metallopeptidase [Fusobacterium perfoetens]|uniref:M16 family metallopeptidase n=1 Tax=Fusobacterium perfoetens TaxID=852 RepID=UPI000486C734|nr:M16 family metallopeptidase [Fusobacterium perfoetens]